MLTDLKARNATPREKDYKLGDSRGLYLFVTTKGFRSWRMKYRFYGKEKRLTFGPYPEVSLQEAREKRDEARRLLRDNHDPAVEQMKRKLTAASDHAQTFETVARRWYEMHKPRWTPVHASDVIKSWEREIFPSLGCIPISQLDVPLVLAALRKIESRGSLETAKRGGPRTPAALSDERVLPSEPP